MPLRLAVRDDIPAILAISNWAAAQTPANFAIEPETIQSWTETFDKTQAAYPWLVATDDRGTIIGFAKAGPHKGRCAYAYTAEVSVYIDPKHHGQGVGTSLYALLIPLLKAQGYVTLIAGITTPNSASERLHATFGFKHVGTFERVGWKFNRWHNVSYYEVLLNDGPAPSRLLPVNQVWSASGHQSAVVQRA
jgi:L-amino acid N-acyltransferase